jgi:hypothetical protein
MGGSARRTSGHGERNGQWRTRNLAQIFAGKRLQMECGPCKLATNQGNIQIDIDKYVPGIDLRNIFGHLSECWCKCRDWLIRFG